MSRTILLADDSVTIQKVVELTFMDEDYQVVSVGTGDEAIQRLGEISPDLLIADIHMPGADGYEVCRSSKQSLPGRPVLLLVGTFEAFSEEKMTGVGADGLLKKPFDSQELLRRVEELLARAQATAGRPAPVQEPEQAQFLPQESPLQAVPEPPVEAPVSGPVAPTSASNRPSAAVPMEEDVPSGVAVAAAAAEGVGTGAERSAEVASTRASVAAVQPEAGLSEAEIDRIARKVSEILGEKVIREVAWDVIPDMAEIIIRARLRELESQVE